MSFLDQINSDAAAMTTGVFSSPVDFIATSGETATIQAIANKIGRKLNTDLGTIINTKNATVVFSESVMVALYPLYPVRNSAQEVSMIGHLINVADNTGIVKNYIVLENIPDESAVGLITLILGDYVAN